MMASKRIQMCLTQEQLGNLVGVTKQCISMIERGESNPSSFTAKQLAIHLCCDYDSLFSIVSG